MNRRTVNLPRDLCKAMKIVMAARTRSAMTVAKAEQLAIVETRKVRK